jgi:hypothetical protein
MQPLSAEILTETLIGDERIAVRRSLRLGVSASSSGHVAMALILNISETGLLIETLLELAEGETLQVEIPGAIDTAARVIWTEGFLAGCEFASPVSLAAVSAAQLMSPTAAPRAETQAPGPDPPRNGGAWDYDEAFDQTVIVIVTSLISVLAVLIFLAAVLLL